MSVTLRRVLTATLLTSLALVPAGIASAKTNTHLDAEGDVVSFTESYSAAKLTSGRHLRAAMPRLNREAIVAEDPGTPAPTREAGDINRTFVNLGKTRIGIRIGYRDLSKTAAFQASIVHIVTHEGVQRDISLYTGEGATSGQLEVSNKDGDEVTCTNMQHSVDYTADVMVISVPRRCLAYPHWIKTGIGAVTYEVDDTAETFTTYLDDSRTTGDVTSEDLVLSPRVYWK
jgi:hypothetical protein